MKPLDATGSMLLRMQTRGRPMHVAGVDPYAPPPGAGAGFIGGPVQGWRRHRQAAPPCSRRPVLKPGPWDWTDDKHFEPDHPLRHVALPQPGRMRELLAMVSRMHAKLPDRNHALWAQPLGERAAVATGSMVDRLVKSRGGAARHRTALGGLPASAVAWARRRLPDLEAHPCT